MPSAVTLNVRMKPLQGGARCPHRAWVRLPRSQPVGDNGLHLESRGPGPVTSPPTGAGHRSRLVLALLLLGLAPLAGRAQVNYTGGAYVQNFNALAGPTNNTTGIRWTDNTTLPGWYADRAAYTVTSGTLGGTATAFDDTAVAANSGLFSFGAAGASDRALGTRAAAESPVRVGVRLINQTGRTITRFAVAYTGEQWFKSSAATAHALAVEYQLGAAGLLTGTWTAVPTLTFSSPVITPNAAALDGNVTANHTHVHAVVTGVSWEPGQELWIRFSDTDETGAEHGLAVDDFALWTGEDGAVFFNGLGRYVTMGATSAFGLSVFTLECWFLQTGPGITTNTGTGGVTGEPLVTKGRGEADGSNVDCNYFLGIDAAGRLIADFEAAPAAGISAGQNYPITGSGTVIPGAWNHAAVTFDGTRWRLYLNGMLDATLAVPTGATPRADSIQHFAIGSALNSTGVAAGFFQGVIDEVRVWYVARNPAEILATRDIPVPAETAGLVARYSLNEGTGTAVTSPVPGVTRGTLVGGQDWTVGRRLVVNQPPVIALTSPTTDYRGMFPATVPFAVNTLDPDGVVLKVEFYADSTKIGETTTAPFVFAWSQVPAGTYSLSAAAIDNSGGRTLSAPISISVAPNPNRAPTLTLASPAADTATIGAATTLGVTVTDPELAATRVTFYGRKTAPPTPGPDFTLGTLPDTQYYAENINGRSRHFFAQTQWYVDNRDVLNLAFVSHMGDIVDHGDIHDVTKQSNLPEWAVADAAMKLIENRVTTLRAYGIPWGAAPGNHDQTPIGNAGGTTTFFNQFFGVSRFAGRPYYGGHYGTNNNNNYQLFQANGLEFIILHLEYDARDVSFYRPVLDWADAVLKAHPHRRAIVTSHWIVNTGNPATFSPQGRAIYDHLKNNPNLFLLLCGHVSGEGQRSDVYEGRTVHSVLQDYQSRANGGDGWLRTFTFSPARNTISARTYSPSLARAEVDANSEFTLPYDMQGAITDWVQLGTVNVPAGATTATLNWTGLAYGSYYEWRATAQDEINTTTTSPRRFSTVRFAPPVIALTAPAPGARLPISVPVQLTANATGEGAITRVEFYQNETKIGEATTAPFAITWSSPFWGEYALSAIAIDDVGGRTLSRIVNVSLFNPNNREPAVAFTAPTTGTRVIAPAAITLAATASDSDGTIAHVEFFNGAAKLGESRTAPYTFAWNAVPAGNYVITVRASDNDGGVTTSPPVALSVVPPVVANLIAADSTWKYLDDGTDQGTAWRAPGFDDTAWASGVAEFGYGDGDETTVIGFGPNPSSRAITTYFRRTFAVTDPARVGELALNLVRDDGAIVYLNGAEIGRSAMTVGTIYAHDTPAPTTVEGTAERAFFPLGFSTDPRPLLVRGLNTLAVEVHQSAGTSSDLSFNLELLDRRLPVGSPPAVVLTAPVAGATFATGTSMALAATAADPDGSLVRVEFLLNGSKLGEATTPPYAFTWIAPTAGTHVLVATATDNDGNVIASAPVSVVVRESDPGRFVNFSIRNHVGPGTGTLIVGFVTGGAGTQGNRQLILRAIGPALAAFGVENFSSDPVATLLTGTATIATNDNWGGNAQVVAVGARVGAFPLSDPASRDAALVATRPVGAHSLQVSGTNGTALAEIYDSTLASAYTPEMPRLINISARALVGSGDNELIAGMVVGGGTVRTVLIRAIGPSLAGFGVANALAETALEVFRAGSSTAIALNDDWGGGAILLTAFAKVGAFALAPTSRDAAVLVRLAPGAYTARVTSTPGATGVALVEIYEVP